MHAILLFLGVWGGWVASTAAFFAIALWLFSVDEDAEGKKWTTDLLMAMFWPVIWLYLRISGRDLVSGSQKRDLSAATGGQSPGSTDRDATRFRTIREAKDYLAGSIADEAQREGAPLTDVERKMLYFTETGWTLPDMRAVSAEFDRSYDQGEYERKIAGLVSNIQARDDAQGERDQEIWDRAIEKLSRGDHYMNVLVAAAQPQGKKESWVRHSFKVVAAALLLFVLFALRSWFLRWLNHH